MLCRSFTISLMALFHHSPSKAPTEKCLTRKIFNAENNKVHPVAFKRVASSVDTSGLILAGNLKQDVSCCLALREGICVTSGVIRGRKVQA